MPAEYMHVGIPVTNEKPGMAYNEGMKIWMSNPGDLANHQLWVQWKIYNPQLLIQALSQEALCKDGQIFLMKPVLSKP
jgi:hypothetical protein